MANMMTLTTPLMRQTVGFDRFNDLFETLLSDKSDGFDNYPPYNIEKHGEDDYRIVMAVAGFGMDDLDIVLQHGELTVSGNIQSKDAEEDGVQLLHRGIGMRSFERTFRLADYIKVTGAEMKDGLLTISLEREIPEEKKPRMIPIKGAAKQIQNKKKN
jgi:molecular chaperone IbpA